MTLQPTVGAAVDIGSNSVHLLVATIVDHRLETIVEESAFLGLGVAVDEDAHLGPARRDELSETLRRYVALARGHDARVVTLLGTEPIRRAADAERIVAAVERATGVPMHVLSHEEEAYLTLVGVTDGIPVAGETLAIDIGGGSSEFADAAPGRTARAWGIRLGSDRLTKRFVRHDPATQDEVDAMTAAALEILSAGMPAAPRDLVIVGGTASNLLKLTAAPHDLVVTAARLDAALAVLGESSASDVAKRFSVNPRRTPLLPAGIAIVRALMRHYGMDRARVSHASLREGAILIADHVGREWRDRLPGLAHGWRG